MPLCRVETPPRVWGRQWHHHHPRRYRGNTPTGVGKTSVHWRTCIPAEKHPHGCGEDATHSARITVPEETPPRVWGRHGHDQRVVGVIGNTPTGVGKTAPLGFGRVGWGKHPHGCGEDLAKRLPACASPETPPRVWGRPISARPPAGSNRNTPTGVGKTACSSRSRARRRKHPHGCGEDPWFDDAALFKEETPPRVWGRRGHVHH